MSKSSNLSWYWILIDQYSIGLYTLFSKCTFQLFYLTQHLNLLSWSWTQKLQNIPVLFACFTDKRDSFHGQSSLKNFKPLPAILIYHKAETLHVNTSESCSLARELTTCYSTSSTSFAHIIYRLEQCYNLQSYMQLSTFTM